MDSPFSLNRIVNFLPYGRDGWRGRSVDIIFPIGRKMRTGGYDGPSKVVVDIGIPEAVEERRDRDALAALIVQPRCTPRCWFSGSRGSKGRRSRFVVQGALTGSADTQELRDELTAIRRQATQKLQTRLEQAKCEGDLPQTVDVARYGRVLLVACGRTVCAGGGWIDSRTVK